MPDQQDIDRYSKNAAHDKAAVSGRSETDCSADLSDEQIRLAEALGSFLWESSTLRHGLFTPPEFSRLVSERIKQYFYEQNDQSEARDQ